MFPKLPGHDPTLDPKRFRGLGPHLGMAEKFGVLLVRQGASLARYTRNWNGAESQRPTRYWVDGSALTFAIAEEAFDGHVRGDLELHTEVTFHLALLLYSGYRHYGHDLPPWLALGLAHWHARRVCPRYPAHLGRYDGDREERGFWKWDERSAGLLRSRAFEPLAVLMARTDIASFGFEQHMQSWALVDWLLRTKRAATCVLVHELKEPFHQLRRRPSPSELKRRGMQCLETAFGMTPTGLEEAWRADVAEK